MIAFYIDGPRQSWVGGAPTASRLGGGGGGQVAPLALPPAGSHYFRVPVNNGSPSLPRPPPQKWEHARLKTVQ